MKHYTLREFWLTNHGAPKYKTIRESKVFVSCPRCAGWPGEIHHTWEHNPNAMREVGVHLGGESLLCIQRTRSSGKFVVMQSVHCTTTYYSRKHWGPSWAEMSVLEDIKYPLTLSWDICLIHNTQNQDVPDDLIMDWRKGGPRWISSLETISATWKEPRMEILLLLIFLNSMHGDSFYFPYSMAKGNITRNSSPSHLSNKNILL